MSADIINLIRQRATAYAQSQGASPQEAQAFANTAIAIAYSESNFNPTAIGDGGASVGLFQLHSAGRGAGMSVAQRQDPETNIAKSLPELYWGWRQIGGIGAYNANPASAVAEVSRVAQRPNAQAHANAVRQGVFATGLQYAGGQTPAGGGIISPVTGGPTPAPGPNPTAARAESVNAPLGPTTTTGTGASVGGSFGAPATAGSPVGISRQTGGAEPGLAGTPAPTRLPNIGPAPTNASAAAALVRERASALLQRMQTEQDPGQVQMLLGTYTAMVAQADALENPSRGRATYTVGDQSFDIDSETAARLAQDYGITQQQIQMRREEQEADFAQKYALAQLQISADAVQRGADRQVEWARLQQSMQQFEQEYGLNLQKIEVDWARLGLDRDIAAASQAIAQGQLGVQQGQLDLSRELGRGNLELDKQRFGLDQQRLQADLASQERQYGLELRQTESQERQQTIAALVDLVGMEIQAGNLTARQAEKAIDALVDLYKADPTAGEYVPGYEPGGPAQVIMERMGAKYDPAQYRKRTFPIDLTAMAKASTQFDMSKAWQQAQQLMAGQFPNVQGGVPAPGGGMAPATAMAGQSPGVAPNPAAQSGFANGTGGGTAATSKPVVSPGIAGPTAPAGVVGQPPAQIPGAAPQMPAAGAPASPGVSPTAGPPPDCGPGYAPAWDGNQWVCKATSPAQAGQAAASLAPIGAPQMTPQLVQ